MIVKVGALTSVMAGSMGGGRITTFPYTEITGIEYNAGLLNGVLEILTASYQRTTLQVLHGDRPTLRAQHRKHHESRSMSRSWWIIEI